MGTKIIKKYIPPGPTVVWKRDPKTGKIKPTIVKRKGYYRWVKVNN